MGRPVSVFVMANGLLVVLTVFVEMKSECEIGGGKLARKVDFIEAWGAFVDGA